MQYALLKHFNKYIKHSTVWVREKDQQHIRTLIH